MASSRLPPTVRPFPNLSLKNVQANYFPGVALFGRDADDTTSNNAVKRLLARNAVDKAQPDVLRWKVVTHTSAKYLPLSTQRNRLRRRWSSAIIASLGKHNLRPDGKLRDRSDLSVMKGVQELRGTLEVLIHQGQGFEMEPEQMQMQTDKIVEGLLKTGLGTRRITSTELERNGSDSRPAAQPVSFRTRDGSRAKAKRFDPSRHRPSWKTPTQNT